MLIIDKLLDSLELTFGTDRVSRDAQLAPLTTLRAGGIADCLVEVRNSGEVVTCLEVAHESAIPVTLLGGGSNVLIGDHGIRGLVIRIRGGKINHLESEVVQADAGTSINGLVRWTINRGFGGLESWAGTPGTVGGAIYGNAHFDGRLMSDVVQSVGVAERSGQVREMSGKAMEFEYDYSRLQRTGEVLLWSKFCVVESLSPGLLREMARRSLAYRKRTQPLDASSAGCVFKNPVRERDQLLEGVSCSAGELIDRAGLKGRRIGQACVSHTHANFIVNEGGATSRDIRSLINLCKVEVRRKCGVDLKEEIVYLGEF